MARPRKHISEQRTERVNLRFTPGELSEIGRQALVAGMPLSSYLRDVGLGHQVKVPIAPDVLELVHEVNKLGVNVHQITKRLNADGGLAHDAERVLAKVEAVLDRALSAL